MRLAGSSSWRVSEDRWPEEFDVALWFRAAERIDVPSGGVVPGAPDVEPLPDPGTDPSDAAELAAGWLAWWHSLVGLPPLSPPFDPAHPPALLAFSPPDFPSLAVWPALRQVVTGRWRQAYDWHNTRKKAGLEASLHHDRRTGQVVAELERELGRKARPCSLDLVLLPVRDEQVRAVPVSSMSAQIVNVPQFQASYHASKAGVSMLAQALGVEWVPRGVRVNATAPGYMLSEMTRQFTDANPDLARQWTDAIPIGRIGRPEDLSGLVGFLASDASAYLTSQTIVIDGGYAAV